MPSGTSNNELSREELLAELLRERFDQDPLPEASPWSDTEIQKARRRRELNEALPDARYERRAS